MMSWAEFKHLISTWTNVPVERLSEETDLTCDVGLDSLALEQVLTGVESLIPGYTLTEFWRMPTLKALYNRYQEGVAAQRS